MKDFKGKLYDVFNKMTYKYQHEKSLAVYIDKKDQYLKMSDDDFSMQYIEVNAKYERQMIILSILSISFIASIVFGLWRYIFMMIVKMTDVIDGIPLTNDEYFNLGIVCIAFGATVSITVISIFYILLKDMHKLSKEKYLLEEMKVKRIYSHSSM